MTALTQDQARLARRELWRKKWGALALVAPLLVFLFFAFVAPIASMLYRGVHNPVVAELIPDTLQALHGWDGEGRPDDATLARMAMDLKRLAKERTSGKLAEEVNRHLPGASSLIKSSARKLRRASDAELAVDAAALLLAANPK